MIEPTALAVKDDGMNAKMSRDILRRSIKQGISNQLFAMLFSDYVHDLRKLRKSVRRHTLWDRERRNQVREIARSNDGSPIRTGKIWRT